MNDDLSQSEASDVQEVISKALDDIGRSLSPEATRAALSYVELVSRESEQGNEYLLRMLGIRVEFVLDSNAVQRLLRRHLQGKESISLLALQSGFVRVVAPEPLDLEIARHAPDIASDCGKSADDVLREYFRTIRPYVEVVDDIDPAVLAAVRQGIRDPDDAPFVALYIERGSVGIITQDEDIRSYPEVKCYDLVDVARIHVTYRQQFIVVSAGFMGTCLGIGVVKSLLGLLAALLATLRLAARHFALVAVGASIVMLVGYFFRKEVADFLSDSLGLTGDRWRRFKASLRELWTDVKPVVITLLTEGARRIAEAAAQTEELRSGARPQQRLNGPARKPKAARRVTYELLLRCVALARGTPLSGGELVTAIEALGYRIDKLGGVGAVNEILRRSPAFTEVGDGRFMLRDGGRALARRDTPGKPPLDGRRGPQNTRPGL